MTPEPRPHPAPTDLTAPLPAPGDYFQPDPDDGVLPHDDGEGDDLRELFRPHERGPEHRGW